MSSMAIRWYNIVVDSRDHHALARWWAQVLDWKIVYEDAEETSIAREEGAEPGAHLRCGPGGENGQEPAAHRPRAG